MEQKNTKKINDYLKKVEELFNESKNIQDIQVYFVVIAPQGSMRHIRMHSHILYVESRIQQLKLEKKMLAQDENMSLIKSDYML